MAVQTAKTSDVRLRTRDGQSRHQTLPRRLCAIAEAARYLALSTWTVREMCWRGDLPHIRQGRRILIDLHDLDEWVARSKVRGV
jgi:excisionase family DNA binding protein